jgi:preprotein translocase subunit SecE
MTTPVTFFKETYDELKKVVWPTRDEVIRLTAVVIFISVAIGLYIGGLDYLLAKLLSLIATK